MSNVALLQERPPYVRFDIRSVEKRDVNGNPVITDVPFVLVTPAGSKDVFEAPAEDWISGKEQLARRNPPEYHPEWARKFRSSFELWSQGSALPEDGTPIRTWPALSPSEVKRCINANVLTVEDLAQANAQALANLGMGAQTMKDKAVAWLKDREGTQSASEIASLRGENAELKRRLDEQDETMRKIAARMAEPEPKRGRRREVEPDSEDVIK